MSFVQSLRRLLKEKQYSLVLSRLTDYQGPLIHYLIYFKLLLQCVLAVHDTEIGWDVVKLVFPNLSLQEMVPSNWFEMNRQTLKYYKSVNIKLVFLLFSLHFRLCNRFVFFVSWENMALSFIASLSCQKRM